MGFVYNNVWEAFCRTYLELNGYFVLSNVFVALLSDEQDSRRTRLEADIIAYKLENTNLEHYLLDSPVSEHDQNSGEFFAGEQGPRLLYCEVKANLSSDQSMVARLLNGDDRERIQRKANRIHNRLGSEPRVVIVAFHIDDCLKEQIRDAGWQFKEFTSIYEFMRNRFQEHGDEKGRIQYNDPWLEMMRFLQRLPIDH